MGRCRRWKIHLRRNDAKAGQAKSKTGLEETRIRVGLRSAHSNIFREIGTFARFETPKVSWLRRDDSTHLIASGRAGPTFDV